MAAPTQFACESQHSVESNDWMLRLAMQLADHVVGGQIGCRKVLVLSKRLRSTMSFPGLRGSRFTYVRKSIGCSRASEEQQLTPRFTDLKATSDVASTRHVDVTSLGRHLISKKTPCISKNGLTIL